MAEVSALNLSLPCTELRRPCDIAELQFERSDQLEHGKRYLGQQRAIDAIRFGIEIKHAARSCSAVSVDV